jgi:hypothetical protein
VGDVACDGVLELFLCCQCTGISELLAAGTNKWKRVPQKALTQGLQNRRSDRFLQNPGKMVPSGFASFPKIDRFKFLKKVRGNL